MSYQKIETAFQQHIATETCWNIPTALRMELISSANALSTSSLSEDEKLTAFYTLLKETLAQQPDSELETQQLLSLHAFAQKHPQLNEQSIRAILTDLCNLNIATPVAA